MITNSELGVENSAYIEKLADILVATGKQPGPRDAKKLIGLIDPNSSDEFDMARKASELLLALQQRSDLAGLQSSIPNVTRFRVSLEKRDDVVIHDEFDNEIYRLPKKMLDAECGDLPLTSPSFRARLRQYLALNHIILTGTELNFE